MSEPVLMPYQNQPFNGDIHVCQEFERLKNEYGITVAVETGSCLYSTTEWLGKMFDKVYTVEINPDFAKYGRHKIEKMPTVLSEIGDSIEFLNQLAISPDKIGEDDSCIFFLDAHWGASCPLLGEMEAISRLKCKPPIVAIHDFYTGNPELGYDEYNGQPFTYEWIKPSIDNLEAAFGVKYEYHFNSEAVGAKRGLIYITPIISE